LPVVKALRSGNPGLCAGDLVIYIPLYTQIRRPAESRPDFPATPGHRGCGSRRPPARVLCRRPCAHYSYRSSLVRASDKPALLKRLLLQPQAPRRQKRRGSPPSFGMGPCPLPEPEARRSGNPGLCAGNLVSYIPPYLQIRRPAESRPDFPATPGHRGRTSRRPPA
jgi:hypothetical protein